MNIESLRSLQKRIREATEPDRELDAAIAKAFGMPHGYHEWIEDRTYYDTFEQAARFTLDPDGLGPCMALQRAVLPGWLFDLRQQHKEDWQARVHRRGLKRTPHDDVFASHRLSTHATLLAIVSAKIAELEAREVA